MLLLPVGRYDVKAEAPGLKSTLQGGFSLRWRCRRVHSGQLDGLGWLIDLVRSYIYPSSLGWSRTGAAYLAFFSPRVMGWSTPVVYEWVATSGYTTLDTGDSLL